jgi:hypothetical protein
MGPREGRAYPVRVSVRWAKSPVNTPWWVGPLMAGSALVAIVGGVCAGQRLDGDRRTCWEPRVTVRGTVGLADTPMIASDLRFRRSEALFDGWRVMDSNQHRTTPTVLQGVLQTGPDQGGYRDGDGPARKYAADGWTWSWMAAESWTRGPPERGCSAQFRGSGYAKRGRGRSSRDGEVPRNGSLSGRRRTTPKSNPRGGRS